MRWGEEEGRWELQGSGLGMHTRSTYVQGKSG